MVDSCPIVRLPSQRSSRGIDVNDQQGWAFKASAVSKARAVGKAADQRRAAVKFRFIPRHEA